MTEGWEFSISGEKSSTTVDLPHCFNTAESSWRDYEGKVLYSRTFSVEDPGLKYHLVIEGSFYKTQVFLNEKLLGDNEGGYLPFRMPIPDDAFSDKIMELKIIIDNRVSKDSVPSLVYPGHAMGFHPYGGLHKAVYLEVIPDVYTFKIHASSSLVEPESKGTVHLQSLFHSSSGITPPAVSEKDYWISVFNPEGSEVYKAEDVISWTGDIGSGIHSFEIENPVPWDTDSPYLYRALIRTAYDEAEVKFGFSSMTIEKNAFLHNGKKTLLKGVCRHEEDVDNGLAQSRESMDKDLDLIQEMGMNFVRLSHYPHDSYFLDQCDDLGILLWEEIPLYQAGLAPVKYIGDKSLTRRDSLIRKIFRLPLMIMRTAQLTRPAVLSQAHDDLLRMIERDYNHPSIRFWGIGNECWSLNPAGAKSLRSLKNLIETRDPGRIAAYAAMTIPGLTTRFERAFGVMDFIGINQYFGWYYGSLEDLDGFMEKLHKKYPDKPLLITETGPDCAPGERNDQPIPPKGVSEDYQACYLKEQYRIMRSKTYFAGLSIWVLKDFLCPEYGTDNIIPHYNLKGLVGSQYERKRAVEAVKKMYGEEQ